MQNLMKFQNMNVGIIVEDQTVLFEIYSVGMALGQVKKMLWANFTLEKIE